jgi:hypothetical protein
VGLAGCLTFIGVYWAGSRGWHRTPVGRNLMAMAAVLGGLLALSLAALAWTLPTWLFLGGMASLDAVMWWRVVLLWKVQHNT